MNNIIRLSRLSIAILVLGAVAWLRADGTITSGTVPSFTNWTITGVSRYVIQFGESIRKSKGFNFTFEDGTAVTIPVYEMERIVREYGAAHQAIPQTIYGGNLIVSPAAGAK